MPEQWTMPIIEIVTSGGLNYPGEWEAFNYFFSLAVGIGFLLFVPVAIIRLLGRS